MNQNKLLFKMSKTHPTDNIQTFINKTVASGAGGAAISALGTLINNKLNKKKLTNNLLRNLLIGTAAGGVIGAGVGYSDDILSGYNWKVWKERKDLEKKTKIMDWVEQLDNDSAALSKRHENYNKYIEELNQIDEKKLKDIISNDKDHKYSRLINKLYPFLTPQERNLLTSERPNMLKKEIKETLRQKFFGDPFAKNNYRQAELDLRRTNAHGLMGISDILALRFPSSYKSWL